MMVFVTNIHIVGIIILFLHMLFLLCMVNGVYTVVMRT